jgi:1,4-dihydroxy-2-naphthoate octaprenyltransferase
MGTGSVATSGCFQGKVYLQVPKVESLTFVAATAAVAAAAALLCMQNCRQLREAAGS